MAIDDAEGEAVDDLWRDNDTVVDNDAEATLEFCVAEKLVELGFVAGEG